MMLDNEAVAETAKLLARKEAEKKEAECARKEAENKKIWDLATESAEKVNAAVA